MKTMTVLAAILVVSVALAEEPVVKNLERGPKQKGVAKFNPKAGGIVFKKGVGEPVYLLDYCGRQTELIEVVRKIGMFTSTYIEIKAADKGEPALKAALANIKDGKCKAVVALTTEGEDAPAIIACPEDHIAIINIDRYKKDASDDLLFERVTKELWRSVALILGGYASDHPCALKAVNSLDDLDKECLSMTCPPVNGKVMDNAKILGIAPLIHAPYFLAVRQGWAPAPTNDVQRAVWAKWHTNKVEKAEAPKAEEVK